MELLCKACEKPIESHDDVINFKHQHSGEWLSYHCQCYADQFNAPHALLTKE